MSNLEKSKFEIEITGVQEFLEMNIPIIKGGFGKGEKVVLAKTVAEIHDVELRDINKLINNNLDEFEEGIDLLDLKGNEKFAVIAKNSGLYTQNSINASLNIYLLSEQGYYALVSLMRTDKAKQIRRKLRREYFSMRELLNQNLYKNLSPELRAILMHDVKIQEMQKEVLEVKEDLQEFKDDIPLFTTECKEVVSAVRRRGTKALGGKGTRAYNNKSLRAKVYADIHKQLKREFYVNSYTAIKRKHLKNAIDIVDKYNLTIALNEQIGMINNQVEFI